MERLKPIDYKQAGYIQNTLSSVITRDGSRILLKRSSATVNGEILFIIDNGDLVFLAGSLHQYRLFDQMASKNVFTFFWTVSMECDSLLANARRQPYTCCMDHLVILYYEEESFCGILDLSPANGLGKGPGGKFPRPEQ